MKQHNFACFGILLSAISVFAFSSCVNEEYDVADLDTEITLGAESVALPLGSTKPLTLKSIMDEMNQDMLQILDGGYAFHLNDKLKLGDQLPDMKDMLVIPDVVFTESLVYNLSGVDPESLTIGSQEFSYEFGVADDGLQTSIELPKVNVQNNNSTEIWKQGKSARELQIGMDGISLTTTSLFPLPNIPAGLTNNITVPDFPEAVVETIRNSVEVKSNAPEGISNISDVLMSDDAKMVIKLTATNSFLASGTIEPNLTLDLGGLAVLGGGKEQINIDKSFSLTEKNGYSVTKEFHISEIGIKTSDWNDKGELKLNKTLTVGGSASLSDVVVDVAKLSNYSGSGMGLSVDVSFQDMSVKSLMMDVEVDPVVEKMSIPISIKEMTLPDGVNSINKVVFTEESLLDMAIETQNLDIKGLELKVESLKIIFPESMKVKDTENGIWQLSDVALGKSFNKKLYVQEFVLPAPVDGKISYDAEVELEAVIKIGGRICSADVPYTQDKDGKIDVKAVSSFELDDYYAEIDGLSHEIDLEPEEFSYALPDEISDFGTFTIIPEGNPALTVNIDVPETKLPLQAGDEGFKISFPSFLQFDAAGYNFDHQTNTMTIKGELPDKITLPVKKLLVDPIKDETTGGYTIKGYISVCGDVELAAGELCGKDIDVLMSSKASVNAVVPELVASEILFDEFEIDASEQFEFTILDKDDLPKEVKKISDVQLDDVSLQIDINVKGMPDFGNTPRYDFMLELPEMLVLDENDSRVDGNKVSITGTIKDSKIDVKPIAIKSIDLSDFDLTSGKDLVANMSINGGISVDNPQVDLKELNGDVTMLVDAKIEDIAIKNIAAVLDYKIDGVNQKFQITGLPEFMKGDGFVLDFADPHLILKAKTNLGIPVSGNLSIIPFVGGVEKADAKVEATIDLPYTESAEKTDSVMLWLGSDRGSCPADYTFVEADIRKLLHQIPDEVKLQLNAKTKSDEVCILDPLAEYDLDVEYDFVIPLAFGEDLNIELSDTLYIDAPIVGQLLDKNKLQLAGSISNSLPVQLELNLMPIDKNNSLIQTEVPATQMISAGNSDGSAAVSPLDLTLSLAKGASAADFAGFKVTFAVTAPNSSGRPIGENDFVKADLKVNLPEGITLDVEELM